MNSLCTRRSMGHHDAAGLPLPAEIALADIRKREAPGELRGFGWIMFPMEIQKHNVTAFPRSGQSL